MPLDNKEISYIGLNGISQRPPAVRPEGQVDDMVGFLPTPADGLRTAPTCELLGQLDLESIYGEDFDLTLTNEMFYTAVEDTAGDWYLMCLTGIEEFEVVAWDKQGKRIDVSTVSTSVREYLRTVGDSAPHTSFHVTSYNQYLVLANNSVQIEQLPPPDLTGKTLELNRVEILQEKVTGSFETYALTIDGTSYDVSYPRNSTATLNEIAQAIADNINAGIGFTATLEDGANIIDVTNDTAGLSFTMTSGTPDKVLAIQGSVTSFDRLPTNVPYGTILKIQPDVSKGRVTPYWVEYDNDVWTEVADPYASAGFGSETTQQLPVTIRAVPIEGNPTYSAQLQITAQNYTPRRAGDEESNRAPFFVSEPTSDVDPTLIGGYITNLIVFEGRLGFVSSRGIDWSRINHPETFYRETAVEVYDDDPIIMSFGGTNQSVVVSEATLFHDVVFVNTNNGKYLVEGGANGFTPTNYKTSRVSSLGGDFTVPAVTVEDKLFFAASNGDHLQFREYQYGDDYIDVEPTDITIDIPNMIPTTYTHSASFDEMRTFILTDCSGGPSTEIGWCYRYDVDKAKGSDAKIQSAWFKLPLRPHVGIVQVRQALYLIDTDGWLFRLDLRRQLDHKLCSWNGCYTTGGGDWYVKPPAIKFYGDQLNDACYMHADRDDGSKLYAPVFSVDLDTGLVSVEDAGFEGDYTEMYVGLTNTVSLTLPEPFVRNDDGFGVSEGTMRIRDLAIYTRNSGEMEVDVNIADRDPLRPTVTRSHTFGEDYETDVQQLDGPKSLYRYDRMPVNNKSTGMTTTIKTSSVRPLDIISVAYNYRFVTNKRIR